MRADDAAADASVRALIEEQLGESLVASVRNRATGSCPREHGFPVLDALRLALFLGQSGPGNLGVGVRNRRNLPRVEVALLSGRGLGSHMRFVHGLVREHRLS